jgi:hypothetical protein
LSACSLSSDSVNRCRTNTFDGRSVTTVDESGRTVTRAVDGMGRPSIERVPGIPDVTYAYGPFSLLSRMMPSDGTGQTDFTFDVRGRPISTKRKNIGSRVRTLNAFGDVVGTDLDHR